MSQHMPHTALLESLMKGAALMWGDEGGNVFGCPNITMPMRWTSPNIAHVPVSVSY